MTWTRALRRLSPLTLVMTAAAVVPACAATPRPPEATLRVVRASGPPVATGAGALSEVYVDDRPTGHRDGPPVGLRAGLHRVEVRAPGCFAAYRQVTLKRGERRVLPVALHADLDHPNLDATDDDKCDDADHRPAGESGAPR